MPKGKRQGTWQQRWVAVPDELMEPVEEPWTVSPEPGHDVSP